MECEGARVQRSKGAGTRAVGPGEATGRGTWSEKEQAGSRAVGQGKRQGGGQGVRGSKGRQGMGALRFGARLLMGRTPRRVYAYPSLERLS